ncbi:DUF721 domain-containing protein [Desulfatiglans anilini]|uniref:DUF721 domain-containing protein n=1 Tax=Desulfatiglans anilini TaxID=90728 RepID=UPI0004211A55|nr:DUF721 domain-containing protein [Desulfatiglans anilini]
MEYTKKTLMPIKDILAEILESRSSPLGQGLYPILRIWEQVMGKAIAEHARPVYFKDAVLKVSVTDPVWMQELTYREPEIKEKLDLALGRNVVRKVVFRMGH